MEPSIIKLKKFDIKNIEYEKTNLRINIIGKRNCPSNVLINDLLFHNLHIPYTFIFTPLNYLVKYNEFIQCPLKKMIQSAVIIDDISLEWVKDNIYNLNINKPLTIINQQYPFVIPQIKFNYIFIFKETINIVQLYDYHCKDIIPSFDIFLNLINECQKDPTICLVINMKPTSSNLEDNIFWYRPVVYQQNIELDDEVLNVVLSK